MPWICPGRITEIEAIIPDAQLKDVQEKLKADLPATLSINRPEQRGEQIEKNHQVVRI